MGVRIGEFRERRHGGDVLLGEAPDDLGADVEEEDGSDE
jgi:hypothetical protein